ncbi:MAG: transposase [Myxococcaceae bacterium]
MGGGAGAVQAASGCARAYQRRRPEESALYEAVRAGLNTFLEETERIGRGLPRYVRQEFERYLECGILAHGFVRVRCDTCKDEVLVAFSCKRRGVCPSCNAKRAHLTAAHLVDGVLPQVPYRQWTFSFPWAVRFALARDVKLLSSVLTLCLRGLFAFQRRRAKKLGVRGGHSGAVTFVQRFGSALQLTPHFHVVAPDGVFTEEGGEVRFAALPAPSQEEVEGLLRNVVRKVGRRLGTAGCAEEEGVEDALGAYQADSLQRRFGWAGLEVRPAPRKQPRCAFVDGYSLHANTHLHAHDREGLEKLCRYGARGALALERLTHAGEGRIAFRMKRPPPDGRTHLLFTPVQLLRKLATLVPPPRSNLVRFHGVFAPGAKLRPLVVKQVPSSGVRVAKALATSFPSVSLAFYCIEPVRFFRGRIHARPAAHALSRFEEARRGHRRGGGGTS